jgi:hypothetical protein
VISANIHLLSSPFDGVEVYERLEFIVSLANGGSKSINMNIRANGGANLRINLEVDEVVELLIPLIKLCQC